MERTYLKRVVIGWLVTLVVTIGIIWWAAQFDPAPLAGEVASHLKEQGVVLYVMTDQPESNQQQQLFGRYLSDITVVNCTNEVERCTTEQIEDLPTWVFPQLGIELAGLQTPAELKNLLTQLKIW